MTRVVQVSLFLAALGLLGLVPSQSQAWGLSRRGGGGCEVSCAPCEVVAPAPPKMVEHKITRYQPVWKDQEVVVNVCKMVTREEKYTCITYVPVTKPENRKVTTYQCVTKEVDVKYTVM